MDLSVIRDALEGAERTCRYHGAEFTPPGQFSHGLPRCESCRHPWRVTQALIQLDSGRGVD